APDRQDRRSLRFPLRPVDMRRLLRYRHAARQPPKVTPHPGRRGLELSEVFFGQTIEPDCACLVTEFFGHRMQSPACVQFPQSEEMIGRIVSFRHANRRRGHYRLNGTLISFLQTRLNPQMPKPAMIRIAVGGPTCPDRMPIIITPTGPVPMHI